MGFKRTTEGRVFFQNLGESSASSSSAKAATSGASSAAANPITNTAAPPVMKKPEGSVSQQAQIVALLKSLNQRLQSTQADRDKLQQELETYKSMVLDLQDKSKKQEADSAQILKKLDERGDVSAKRIAEAEKLSREAFKEFEEARRLIAEIEERAERTESLVKKQQIQSLQAEERVRTKWEALEQSQQRQAKEIMGRIGKGEDAQKLLGERIEESLNASNRLERKIEKAVHDRARLIRKLERIEETVLQTNEALNARAMVLLTDQNAAVGSGFPAAPALAAAQNIEADAPFSLEAQYHDVPWWKKSMKVQATSVSLIVLGAALLGWFVSAVQKPGDFDLPVAASGYSAVQNNENALSSPPSTAGVAGQSDFSADTSLSAEAASAFDQMIAEQQEAVSSPVTAATEMLPNDIGAIDLENEEQLLAALDGNPDALAAQLNAIEPSSLPDDMEAMQGDITEASTAGESAASMASSNNVHSLAQESFAKDLMRELGEVSLPTTLNGTVRERISADRSLPVQIREIESKAFEGNAEAQHDLAAIYVAGHAGVKQDYKRAAQWFDEAAHNGIANARYNLGVLHHQGIGFKQDINTAFSWYKTAAALGHPEAQYNLGIAYIEGVGVPYDPQRAAVFFENAAGKGVMEAAYNLGLIYENGLLGKSQPDTALLWYKRAADKGSPEAKAALEQLAKSLGMSVTDVNRLIESMDVSSFGDQSAAAASGKKKLN